MEGKQKKTVLTAAHPSLRALQFPLLPHLSASTSEICANFNIPEAAKPPWKQ